MLKLALALVLWLRSGLGFSEDLLFKTKLLMLVGLLPRFPFRYLSLSPAFHAI